MIHHNDNYSHIFDNCLIDGMIDKKARSKHISKGKKIKF